MNHLNKKKLKLNLLLNKDWEKVVGIDFFSKTKLKTLSYHQKSDSCSIEILCDPSIVFDLRSRLPEVTLRIEQTIGMKVKKIHFFQDIFSGQYVNEITIDKKYEDLSNKVNKTELNGIKDVEANLIFERINRSIKNENK
ncbi:hypothetical protein OAC15_01045 [Alphaproteobacteria bacterium]|nr:hypothetical protein [Alphaproteobacteria bacterium]